MNLTNPSKLFPLFVTTKLTETKQFYTQVLGFEASVDTPVYFQVTSQGKDGPELCFMTPDAFNDGATRPSFGGEGVIVSIPTKNADARHQSLLEAGVTPLSSPSDKPWGWRSFLVRDPNGIIVDFFHVVAEKSM